MNSRWKHSLTLLAEKDRFEHFASYVTVRRHHPESFDSEDIVTGDGDTGIDGIAILANGLLVTDGETLVEQAGAAGYLDVTFIFVQAGRAAFFDSAKIGMFGFGIMDFFRDQPSLKRNPAVTAAAEIQTEIYKRSSK